MARFGYDEARLANEHALVQAAAEANAAQEQRKSEARAATRERDAALREISTWMSEVKVVFRVAMGRRSQAADRAARRSIDARAGEEMGEGAGKRSPLPRRRSP